MTNPSLFIIVPLVVALLAVGWVHPRLVRIAAMKMIVDNPDARKLQKEPIPILGGVAVMFGAVLGISCTAVFPETVFNDTIVLIIAVMMVMLYTGTMDDIFELTPRLRFLIEIMSVCALIFVGGFRLDDLHGLWGVSVLPDWVAVPLTVFACVGIINAMNLIDGVDGLSSGFCITACAIFSAVFFKAGDMMMFILSMALIGALIPFFMHNVFGERSKMFIGDGGTLVMGAVMSIFVVRVLGVGSPVAQFWDQSHAGMSAVAFTLAVLCVPVFDTLRVMVTRMLQGRSPFHPDKTHLHHMFIDLGFSHVGTTFSIILLNLTVVAVWWASVSMGCSLDVQLYVVILFGSLFTIFLYPAVAAAKRRNAALYRALTAAGRMTHFERKGFFLLLRKAMDRM
ncbi:MAG: MraY family glycosyltransferase [Alistipes sp.]|nr:MraY family glycosyltransferase [Alistipes sp.]